MAQPTDAEMLRANIHRVGKKNMDNKRKNILSLATQYMQTARGRRDNAANAADAAAVIADITSIRSALAAITGEDITQPEA